MSLVDQILLEGKQVGVLYHYTSFIRIESILGQDCIKPTSHVIQKNGENVHLKGISTTRDQMFHENSDRGADGIGGHSIRIALDGNKISNRFKIIPVNYFNSLIKQPARPKNTESEEFIVSADGLTNLKNYILHITIFPDKEVDDVQAKRIKPIIRTIKSHGIKVELDEIWLGWIEENPEIFVDEDEEEEDN